MSNSTIHSAGGQATYSLFPSVSQQAAPSVFGAPLTRFSGRQPQALVMTGLLASEKLMVSPPAPPNTPLIPEITVTPASPITIEFDLRGAWLHQPPVKNSPPLIPKITVTPASPRIEEFDLRGAWLHQPPVKKSPSFESMATVIPASSQTTQSVIRGAWLPLSSAVKKSPSFEDMVVVKKEADAVAMEKEQIIAERKASKLRSTMQKIGGLMKFGKSRSS